MKFLYVFYFFVAPAAVFGLTITPPKEQWVRVGQEMSLVCGSSEPVKTCTWSTPYNKTYTLSEGLQTEGGRLKYHSEKSGSDCGITITKIEASDGGIWKCDVGVVQVSEIIKNYKRFTNSLISFFFQNSELTTESGKVKVSFAKKPESVKLAEPFHKSSANVSVDKKNLVRCVVSKAEPKPIVSWYIGDQQLVDYKTEDDESNDGSFIQTLEYIPDIDHANKTLKCVVEHIGFDEEEKKESGFLVSLGQIVEEGIC
jgi:hypothetical protein